MWCPPIQSLAKFGFSKFSKKIHSEVPVVMWWCKSTWNCHFMFKCIPKWFHVKISIVTFWNFSSHFDFRFPKTLLKISVQYVQITLQYNIHGAAGQVMQWYLLSMSLINIVTRLKNPYGFIGFYRVWPLKVWIEMSGGNLKLILIDEKSWKWNNPKACAFPAFSASKSHFPDD